MKVIMTVRTESLIMVFAQRHAKNPITIPKMGPPIETLTKLTMTPEIVAVYPLTNFIKTIKNTMAVPSLRRDSPSTKVLNLTLAPNSLSKATTATGSVAESTQPKAQASNQVRSSSPYNKIPLKMKAMRKAPKSTPGPAKTKMLNMDLLKTCQSQLYAKLLKIYLIKRLKWE